MKNETNKIKKLTQKDIERQESINILRKWIDRDAGLVVVINSVSKSGMSRRMSVYTRDLNTFMNYHVARALGWSVDDRGINVQGCGMDMVFHLVYTLSHVLYSDEERKELKGNGQGCLPWKRI